MYQTYDTLVDDVLQQAPHCPVPTAIFALQRTARDFCYESMILRYVSDPIDLMAGEGTYDIEVPNATESVSAVAVWYNDRPLEPLGFSAKYRWPWKNYDSRQGPPMFWSAPNQNQILLSPIPEIAEANALVIMAAVAPKRNAAGVDDDVLEKWSDTMINGALARIYAIPNQPFTNPQAAKERYMLYRADVAQAKIEANKERTTASLKVRPRTYF